MPSAARQGLDRLLDAYPDADIERIDGQPAVDAGATRDYLGAPLREILPQPAGPWVCIDFVDGSKFAIWKNTGAVYRVDEHGAVEDDPIIQLVPF